MDDEKNKDIDESAGVNDRLESNDNLGVVPPEIPEEIRTEKKWADTLGIDYDEQKVMEQNESVRADNYTPGAAQNPSPGAPQENPRGAAQDSGYLYVMPAEEQLPPAVPESREPMPPTYMVWAVISTICCCLPLGVVAIVFAAQVSTKYYARDFAGARKASERAELWIIIAIVLGVVSNILYVPLSLLSGLMTGV